MAPWKRATPVNENARFWLVSLPWQVGHTLHCSNPMLAWKKSWNRRIKTCRRNILVAGAGCYKKKSTTEKLCAKWTWQQCEYDKKNTSRLFWIESFCDYFHQHLIRHWFNFGEPGENGICTWKNIFALKMMISGLEKISWNSSMLKAFFGKSFFLHRKGGFLHQIANSVIKMTFFGHGGI
jgi:hypothetical protein